METSRVDQFLRHEAAAISRQKPDELVTDVDTRFARDLHRQSFAAVFDAAHALLGGGLGAYPDGLPADGAVHRVRAQRLESTGPQVEAVRAVAMPLAGGRVLVVGRSEHDLGVLRALVLRALLLGLAPAIGCALCIGIFASRRMLIRVKEVNATIGKIMQGQLHERLPAVADAGDGIGQLSVSVNRMLDEIERLMEEVRGVGDDIAHDLRTPLARLRARLEGGLTRAGSLDALSSVVRSAIADLDQAFALITALLRIGQIEGSARRAGFTQVDISAIAAEAGELYQPLAELRGIDLRVAVAPELIVMGDPDLLVEAVANLIDNAIKFTPRGGAVRIETRETDAGAMLSVTDSGPGIPQGERQAALKRFHRGDRSRHVPGHGLGLSLVAAIVRLHLFHLRMEDAAPGLAAEIRCWGQKER